MSTTIQIEKAALLPEHLKQEINDFIEFLVTRENNKKISEKHITDFAGILSEEEANELSDNIKDYRQIDLEQWK